MSSLWSEVDKADAPIEAARWQETMAAWPFCHAYKLRTIELMQLSAGNLVLDLGCGPGADALALAERVGEEGKVSAVDSSSVMISYARKRIGDSTANIELKVADAHDLPFPSNHFDACRADRVFQHLSDPYKALSEMLRVTKPGGRIVAVDPDQDTLVINVDAGSITEKIHNFRREHPANPTIAHRIGGMMADLGARPLSVEGHTLVLTEPLDAFGLVEWPDMLLSQGRLSEEEISIWNKALSRSLEQGSFFYSVTFFITVARKS
jgi:ubiquinone/menaquinone biosynthesis C-methylase UbiE